MVEYNKVKIIAVEEIEGEIELCDISVEDDNSFVAEGVVVHNCKICISLDGGVYRLNPETGQHNGPLIPIHPLCRCVYSYNTYSWQELAKRHNVPFDKRQKAFFDGAVTKTITYDAWLKTLSAAEQVEILGPGRYKLWKSGEIKLSQMATSKRILTIEQLEAIAERELTKVTKFVPVKTIKEAESWAKENITGMKKVNFVGFEVEQANSVLKELDILQRKYGKLGELEAIEIMPETFPMAARMKIKKTLQIRQDMTDKELIRLIDSGIDKSKPGLAGIVDHEIGHSMTPDIFHVSGGKTGFTEFGHRLDDFFKKNITKIEKDLTPYAASARHEFVAEAFAFREAGKAPKWTRNWLKKENIGGY